MKPTKEAPATGTRGEIDWLQANVIAIGEKCTDNGSKVEGLHDRLTKLERLLEARNRRRGDWLWLWVRRGVGR